MVAPITSTSEWIGSGPVWGSGGTRNVPPPSVFDVKFSADKSTLIFIVGDPPVQRNRRNKASYRIYFAPIDLASPARIASPFVAFAVFQQATHFIAVDAPQNGGLVTVTDSTKVGLDGWFFATATNLFGIESDFVGPIRNPIVGTNDERIAPDVMTPVATASDGGLDPWGRQLVKISLQARVPSQSQGVSTVEMENGGQDYTHDFPVTFTNAVGDTTGHGAYAMARIRDSRVLFIEMIQAGQDYTIAPIVVLDAGDGIGAQARAFLTTTGSFSSFQIYLFNYFQHGDLVEGPTYSRQLPRPRDLVHGEFLLYPDAPPAHIARLYFVSLSQVSSRRIDPANAPYVEFPTGIHL